MASLSLCYIVCVCVCVYVCVCECKCVLMLVHVFLCVKVPKCARVAPYWWQCYSWRLMEAVKIKTSQFPHDLIHA